ncbi:Homeodomain-like protein [Chlamydoabsidia padenii]|nr:Homeodomain-like protein [Chlamydoabsidia padenii]
MSYFKTQRVFSPVVLFHNDATINHQDRLPQQNAKIGEYKEKIMLMMDRNAKLWSSSPQETDIDVTPSTSTSSTSSCDSLDTIDTVPNKKRRRGNLPKQVTEFLKQWLVLHKQHPYPSEKEKIDLAKQTGLTVNQISNWFINARRRILQPMLESEGLQHHLSFYSADSLLLEQQNKRRQLDIYAYQGFADTYSDDTRRWAFRRTKLPNFDMTDCYSVAIR